MTTVIETERLILRPHTLDDIEPSYQMNLDPVVSEFTGDGGVADFAEIERRIVENVLGDYQRHGFGRFAVELKEDGRFIGFAGLKYLPDRDEVDLGYRLVREHWGKGLATEASMASLKFGFEDLGLQMIIGMVLEGNHGSVRVLEKCGFQFSEKFMEDGEPALLFRLSRSEWTSQTA